VTIDLLETLRAVIDGIANAGGEPQQIIAPLLVYEFGMPGGTEKVLSPIGFVPVQRAGVLKIRTAS
jgi:inner membrane protein involved in colicin E2 resistance